MKRIQTHSLSCILLGENIKTLERGKTERPQKEEPFWKPSLTIPENRTKGIKTMQLSLLLDKFVGSKFKNQGSCLYVKVGTFSSTDNETLFFILYFNKSRS